MASLSPLAALSGELQLLIQAVQDVYVANLCTVAATTWLGYDILVTLRQEVALIWKARWSIPKLLYFIVRYYTFLSLIFDKTRDNTFIVGYPFTFVQVQVDPLRKCSSCRRWLWYTSYNGTLLTSFLGQAMFLLRLYASYQRSRIVLVTICCVYTAELTFGIVIATLVVSSVETPERPAGLPLPGCLTTPPKHTRLAIIGWSLGLASTCLYFALILYKFAHSVSLRKREASGGSVHILELQTISPLVFSFLRDSAFYFFLVFAGSLLNLVFNIVFEGRALMIMTTVWLSVIYSISASRLCLNTRESLQRRRFQCETGWFEDIEMHEAMSTSRSTRPSGGRVHTPPGDGLSLPKSPAFAKYSLQRPSVSEPRRGSCGADGKRPLSMSGTEDYELISVAPWIILERPGEGTKQSPGPRPTSARIR